MTKQAGNHNMRFATGDHLSFEWRPNTPSVRITERMMDAAIRARAALIAVAATGQTITYKGLAHAIDELYNYRSLGRMLDVLSWDCAERGEPSLAALVVEARTGEPSYGFSDDTGVPIEVRRQHLYQHHGA